MERLVVHHDLWLVDAFHMAELTCQFDGGLVGFQTAVAKERIGHAGQLDQLGSECFLQGDMVVIATVDHLAHLVLQGGCEFGVGVAQGVDGDTRQRVEVALAVGVPHTQTSAMRQSHGQAAVGVHAMGGCSSGGHINSINKNDPTKVEPLT